MTADFFILGAPKCGTSQLFDVLDRHPATDMSRVKEPNYYAHDIPKGRHIATEQHYADLFSGGGLRGEGSTAYFHSEEAVPAILADNPKAKFIVILRKPTDMAVSLFHQQRLSLHEPEARIEDAWADSDNRWQTGRATEMHYNPVAVCYKEACRIGTYLKRLSALIPPDQLHVTFLQDFTTDFPVAYGRLCAFLGLESDGQSNFGEPDKRRAKRLPWLSKLILSPPGVLGSVKRGVKRVLGLHNTALGRSLYKVTTKEAAKSEVPDALRAEMDRFFESEVKLVETLTGRTCTDWHSQA